MQCWSSDPLVRVVANLLKSISSSGRFLQISDITEVDTSTLGTSVPWPRYSGTPVPRPGRWFRAHMKTYICKRSQEAEPQIIRYSLGFAEYMAGKSRATLYRATLEKDDGSLFRFSWNTPSAGFHVGNWCAWTILWMAGMLTILIFGYSSYMATMSGSYTTIKQCSYVVPIVYSRTAAGLESVLQGPVNLHTVRPSTGTLFFLAKESQPTDCSGRIALGSKVWSSSSGFAGLAILTLYAGVI
jgi:hypothetical protein